jgi:hypothetical protein
LPLLLGGLLVSGELPVSERGQVMSPTAQKAGEAKAARQVFCSPVRASYAARRLSGRRAISQVAGAVAMDSIIGSPRINWPRILGIFFFSLSSPLLSVGWISQLGGRRQAKTKADLVRVRG